MKIKPIDDRVLLETLESYEKKVGNIIIPDTAKEKPQIGKIIAVGNDEDLQKIVNEGLVMKDFIQFHFLNPKSLIIIHHLIINYLSSDILQFEF